MKRLFCAVVGVGMSLIPFLTPATAWAALAYDASSKGTATATSLTFSHTTTGSNLILFVGVGAWEAGDTITGVTYNGVAMTLVDKQAVGGLPNTRNYLYYLIAPATGTHNVVISSSASQVLYGTAASYTGAVQSAQPDASSRGSSTTNTATGMVTTVADNSWVVMTSFHQDCGAGCSAGAATTMRQNQGGLSVVDSNGPKTPAGSRTLIVTGNDVNAGWVVASFAPYVAAPPPIDSPLFAPTQQEALFIWGTILFVLAVPFWSRIFPMKRENTV